MALAAKALAESPYRHDDGRVNPHAAAIALVAAYELRQPTAKKTRLGKRRTPEAARKLLARVVGGELGTLQSNQAAYLLNLVACLNDETQRNAHALWRAIEPSWKPSGRDEMQDEWFAPATGGEVIALRLPNWDLDEVVRWHLEQHRHLNLSDGPNLRRWFRAHIRIARALLEGTAPIDSLYLRTIDKFETESNDAGVARSRVIFAIRRLLGPLCAWQRSAGVCRGWHQLSTAERKKILYPALDAERIWLAPARARSQPARLPNAQPNRNRRRETRKPKSSRK